MGQISISITKRAAFRDSTQEWQNVYTYGSLAVNPQPSLANDMIDEVVTKEKAFHGTGVSFILGRVWSSGGTQAENQMISEKTLSGAGALTPPTAMDLERAFLIQWDAGSDSKGRPVRLKKWYHCQAGMGGVSVSNAILQNFTGFTAANRTAIAAAADTLTRISSAVWGLKAESGRERTGDGYPVAHKYLEHHQLGDQWRG